jgi:hypothetical protein
MAKEYRIKHLKSLLAQLVNSTGESMDHYGLAQISGKIGDVVSHKYLYDNLYKGIENAEKNGVEHLKLLPNKVDEIAKFLRYESFNAFVQAQENPIHPILISLNGNYYSYVRKNSVAGAVLQSPVKIGVDNNKAIFQLKGAKWDYTGDLRYDDGCLSCLMISAIGKFFHHVYKIGKSESPQVLIGVFSGISSANDPIGGRCVLVRQELEYGNLFNAKMDIDELLTSDSNAHRKLGRYFSKYEDNNLAIPKPSGFDLDDLD